MLLHMRRSVIAIVIAVTPALTVAGPALADSPTYSWTLSTTGSDADFSAVSVVSEQIIWAAGSKGTVLHTVDGGANWQKSTLPDADNLELRDIEATDAQNALALSIGEADKSRILRTTDGGATWTEVFRNTEPAAFYDCMAFLDSQHGLAVSDPVNGKFQVVATADGGASWQLQPTDGMPAANTGEYAFAGSGSCLVTPHTGATGTAMFGTGGSTSRVFRTSDAGAHWSVSDSALRTGETAGVFGLAYRDAEHAVAVGGDFKAPAGTPGTAATSTDGGATWVPATAAPAGSLSAAAFLPGGETLIGVGVSSEVSTDGGASWKGFDAHGFNAIDCSAAGACWAAGSAGQLASLTRS